ncbi:hypothetical protein [uncultured Christiangramia sp.]|uniref:hypothetical protein n=1 Tax=uncultured Christiangramia sp. TaxID=503836 RepID=UPI00260AC132|nr:hypothetical protein [uncultured Christiangramia sp.]
MNDYNKFPTPSEFYRNLRPENFSDSVINSKVVLTKEQLSYELNQISTNQKHDSFETMCRKMAEKLISPNLIPQVGPTGGGDGKTDSETYPVSEFIAERWYISENNWGINENWAFAISAKADWKSKVKSDVKKIVDTKRDYTKIFFFSNQKIKSKDKKDTQDSIKEKYNVELTILDGEWIIEKVYSNNLLNIVIESLNLSKVHLEEKVLGSRDTQRIEDLSKLEEQINQNELNFELVENCLESAILSRKLELPKTEVIGKFERAKRFAVKLDNSQQRIRIHYQLAWTFLNWYDDYREFYNEFLEFKSLVHSEPNLDNLESYLNLYNLLRTISNIAEVSDVVDIDYEKEEKHFVELLQKCKQNENKPSTSLQAKIYLSLIIVSKNIKNEEKLNIELKNLKSYFEIGINHMDIPFEQLKDLIEIYSRLIPNNKEFDSLINTLAELESKRVSELSSGKIYLHRGVAKMESGYNRESLIYFGKAVRKLAKDETQDEFYFCLMLLGNAYSNLGLYWATYNCYVAAINIYANQWFTKGNINARFYSALQEILKNEVMIGRIPVLLTWYELFNVLERYFENEHISEENELQTSELIDGCLANRILNSDFEDIETMSILPDILYNQNLVLSSNSLCYLLGHENSVKFSSEEQISSSKQKEFFNIIANQPFRDQIIYKTNLIDTPEISCHTQILGVQITITTNQDYQLFLIGETLLAYLESFLATAFDDAFPIVEKVFIQLSYKEIDKKFDIDSNDKNNFSVYLKNNNNLNSSEIAKLFDKLVPLVVGNNYIFKDYEAFFENLYKNDEVHERLSFIIEYPTFLTNVLSLKPKLFLNDWKKDSLEIYTKVRNQNPIVIEKSTIEDKSDEKGLDNTSMTHQDIKAETVIDSHLWDKASWKAFGYLRKLPEIPFGIVLSFENGEAAKKIFKKWIEEYGNEDSNNTISITIIKGINRKFPFWYKILITKKLNDNSEKAGKYISSASRYHRMEPTDNNNLKILLEGWKHFKKYALIPSEINEDHSMTPFLDLAIIKTELKVIEAWEISINHFEKIAINKEDDPIIPSNIKDAPILKVIKEMKS